VITVSDEQAMAVLGNAGMLPKDESDDERYYEVDSAFSGRPDAVRFDEVGDTVVGRVVEAFTRQRTKFGTDTPEFWDDGTPKLEPVIVLLTSDGLRTLYVGSWRMRKAMSEAFAEAGVRGPRPGGEIAVKYADVEEVKGGAQPAKVFEVAYDPLGKAAADPGQLELPGVGGRVAVPPAQPQQRLLSGECAGGEHVNCDDVQCACYCHHPSPPGQVRQHSAVSSPADQPPPF
jgi:hypothetical protein